MDIDTGRLDKAVPTFDAAAERLTDALLRLTEVLCTTSQMCGDDEIGKKFFNDYNPIAQDIQQSLDKAAVGVAKIGAAVGRMSANCTEMDASNAQACSFEVG